MNTRSIARYEAILKITGQARYEGEIAPEGMLHAALVESPIACGELHSLDASRAEATPGFATIVTHVDAASLKPSAATALIREKAIHFHGQPVALVTAATAADAREAVRAVQVSITAQPPVTHMDQPTGGTACALESCRLPFIERRSRKPNNPVLVLRQVIPCGDQQTRLSVLLALLSYSTTST